MNAEQSLRQQNARVLLDATHPAHCGDFPEQLLQRARQSAVGRRHLVRAAVRSASVVFAPDQERWQLWQNEEPWLQWPQQRLHALTRELGVLALAPALRMLLERSAVLFVRGVLGLDNWRRAQVSDSWQGPAPDAVRAMGDAVLQRCGRDPQALDEAVFERGKIEFLSHAERRHESLAKRLALSYVVLPAHSCSADSWLPASAVPALLAEHVALDTVTAAELAATEGSGE
jgi:hypothetical protein